MQNLMMLKRLTMAQSWSFLTSEIFLFEINVARVFPARAASILFLSIFRHKIGV